MRQSARSALSLAMQTETPSQHGVRHPLFGEQRPARPCVVTGRARAVVETSLQGDQVRGRQILDTATGAGTQRKERLFDPAARTSHLRMLEEPLTEIEIDEAVSYTHLRAHETGR